MTWRVVTTSGTWHPGPYSNIEVGAEEITRAQAEALAAGSNKKAEALGLRVRYKVVETE